MLAAGGHGAVVCAHRDNELCAPANVPARACSPRFREMMCRDRLGRQPTRCLRLAPASSGCSTSIHAQGSEDTLVPRALLAIVDHEIACNRRCRTLSSMSERRAHDRELEWRETSKRTRQTQHKRILVPLAGSGSMPVSLPVLPLRIRLSLRLAEVTVHSESESRSPQLRTQAVAQASDTESPGSGRSGSA